MSNYVIIVAGGSGTRMKSAIPKQFLELAGKPVLMHTISNFFAFDPSLKIILVLPEMHMAAWKELCNKHKFVIKHTLAKGGDCRFYSVKNGLELVSGPGIVAIHDGVRPFVSTDTISRCYSKAKEMGNAIPCVSVNETVRQIQGEDSVVIDRSLLRLVQTPQVFSIALIKKAYKQPFQPYYTDDASVLENMGETIHLEEGNRENIKITEPIDLLIGEFLLKNSF